MSENVLWPGTCMRWYCIQHFHCDQPIDNERTSPLIRWIFRNLTSTAMPDWLWVFLSHCSDRNGSWPSDLSAWCIFRAHHFIISRLLELAYICHRRRIYTRYICCIFLQVMLVMVEITNEHRFIDVHILYANAVGVEALSAVRNLRDAQINVSRNVWGRWYLVGQK